jgi:hypothetical protein
MGIVPPPLEMQQLLLVLMQEQVPVAAQLVLM